MFVNWFCSNNLKRKINKILLEEFDFLELEIMLNASVHLHIAKSELVKIGIIGSKWRIFFLNFFFDNLD